MSLLSMSMTGGILILIVLLLRTILKDKLPKKTFILLWVIVLAKLLIPFEINSKTSVYNYFPEVELKNNTEIAAEEYIAPTREILQEDIDISQTGAVEVASKEQSKVLLGIVWGIGAAIVSIYFTSVYFKSLQELKTSLPCEDEYVLHWVERNPLKRNIEVRYLDKINTALTYGILKPTIILPKSLDNSDRKLLESVLRHEYIHIRNFDGIKKFFMVMALILHWFNPLVWVMFIVFNRDIELYCDEQVLKYLGKDSRADYAYTLIEMSEKNNTFSLSSGFSKNALEERVKSIMKFKKSKKITIAFAIVLLVGVSVLFATSRNDYKNSGVMIDAIQLDGDARDFSLFIANGKTRKTEFFFVETTKVQNIEGNYEFRKSKDTRISLLNADGEEREIINSDTKSGEVFIPLTQGMNTLIIESTTRVGEFKLNGSAQDERAITYMDFKSPGNHIIDRHILEEYAEHLLDYDDFDGRFYFKGELVKEFFDLRKIVGKNSKNEKNVVSEVSSSFEDGDIYIYAVRDYFQVDENGVGKLVGINYATDEKDYVAKVEEIHDNVLRLYEMNAGSPSSEKYDEIIEFINLTIDSAKPIEDREKYNLNVPKYVVEVKYHYKEHEDLTMIVDHTSQNSPSGEVYLEKYSFVGQGKPKIRDGIVYETKYYVADSLEEDLLFDFGLYNHDKYIGSTTMETSIEKVKKHKNKESAVEEVDTTIINSGYSKQTESGKVDKEELAKEYSIYKPYGLDYDKKNDKLYFKGKSVNSFMDIQRIDEKSDDENFVGEMFSMNPGDGEVYVYTLRDYSQPDKNGHGKLIGIESVDNEREFKEKVKYLPYPVTIWEKLLNIFK